MVIEMLLNNDIQFFFCSNDFKLSKENKCNFVHYWIKKKVNQIISFEQNINKIWIFKVYVCVMFKMKYSINRMQCNILSQQVKWVDGKGACLNSKGQKIKPHEWWCAVNNGMLIEYSPI
jgi:hypothetical protein